MVVALICLVLLLCMVSIVLASRLHQAVRRGAEYAAAAEEYRAQLDGVRARQHDINNRLLTLRTLCDTPAAQQRDVAALMEDTLDRAREISHLLPFNHATLAALYGNKRKRAAERGIELRVQSQASASFDALRCSGAELVDVVGNLLDNAIEASHPGDRVDLRFGRDGGRFFVSVLNSGAPSVPVEVVLNPGYSTKGSQRGYGLSNVKQIAKKYGGDLEMVLDGDRVTCTVYLPFSA